MSFILDALKKSETERQQQGQAEFSAVPTAPAQSGPSRWLWVLGLLLLINIVVLIGILTRPDVSLSNEPASNRSAVDAASAPGSATTASAPASFEDRVAQAMESQPSITEPIADDGESGTAPLDMAAAEPTATSPPSSLPSSTAILSSAPTSNSVPTIDQLRLEGSLNLPQLHIDIHVFSEIPADRFVFINMSKYRENERTAEGPVVSEITRDGVILSHQGRRFLLPRE
ncbi:MAG: general secretion pathway protein GspB [Pseudomonadota bacterium]